MDEEAANWRFAEACREIVAFFVDDGLVGSRDPVWLQGALDVLVTLFEQALAPGRTRTRQKS